jgi:hypothetical protein
MVRIHFQLTIPKKEIYLWKKSQRVGKDLAQFCIIWFGLERGLKDTIWLAVWGRA